MNEQEFSSLRDFLDSNRKTGIHSVHGLTHWEAVAFNGNLLAEQTGADKTVVRLFAYFHDSCRVSDSLDFEHGPRAAELVYQLRGKHFDLDDRRFEMLVRACREHTLVHKSGDITVDTCFDADRLDLGRVHIYPNEKKMATSFGKELVLRMKKENVAVENIRHWLSTFKNRIED